MRLLQLWLKIWFISIHSDSASCGEGKQTQVFARLCPWVIDVGVIPASLVFTYSLTDKVPCLYLMQMYAKYFYLHCFLILIDHVACESIQMLKTEICRRNTVLAQEWVFKNNFFGTWCTLGTIPWLNFSLVNVKIPYTGSRFQNSCDDSDCQGFFFLLLHCKIVGELEFCRNFQQIVFFCGHR